MKFRHSVRRKYSKIPNAQRTKESSAAAITSMFSNSKDIHITDASFNTTTNIIKGNTIGSSLDVLYNHVAPNAILNAGGRADKVRCHPGTRKEVIARIEKWGDVQDDQTTPIFWLSGPAGAGKSAIAQTIAERCKERGIPQANFFFFRGDPSRSHASPLMATLLHQIILLYPSLRDQVATVLSTNPLLFDSTFEDQLDQLFVKPMLSMPRSSSTHPLILVIDGLDECDSETKLSQTQILSAFDKVLARQFIPGQAACPFRLLVASRDESQIQMAFNKISSQCTQLYLNEEYFPETDIRVFVNAQFEEVRKTHRLRNMLDVGWPSCDEINYIVEKSSGQFIYAATVMRFIEGSSANPMVSLERVRGIRQRATKSPFSSLDAIYTYILSEVDDQHLLKDLLRTKLYSTQIPLRQWVFTRWLARVTELPPLRLMQRLNKQYTKAIICSCLEDLTPLMRHTGDNVEFYHASFQDYLMDQSRSGEYFVNTAGFHYIFGGFPGLLATTRSTKRRQLHDAQS